MKIRKRAVVDNLITWSDGLVRATRNLFRKKLYAARPILKRYLLEEIDNRDFDWQNVSKEKHQL
jgi:hypothetical protein